MAQVIYSIIHGFGAIGVKWRVDSGALAWISGGGFWGCERSLARCVRYLCGYLIEWVEFGSMDLISSKISWW